MAPEVVLNRHIKLRGESRMGELAANLARESFFGGEVMAKSSVFGKQGMEPLPYEKVAQLK